MSSNNYNGYVSYPAQTRNGTSRNSLSRREIYNAPSSGFAAHPDQRDASFSATPSSTAAPGATTSFSINQEVIVWSRDSWVPGVIIGALHYVEAYDRMGYKVKVLIGRGRSIEDDFPQEHVRATPASMQYT